MKKLLCMEKKNMLTFARYAKMNSTSLCKFARYEKVIMLPRLPGMKKLLCCLVCHCLVCQVCLPGMEKLLCYYAASFARYEKVIMLTRLPGMKKLLCCLVCQV